MTQQQMQQLNCLKPACVNVVASAMTKGTFTTRASVFASNVFPVLTVKIKYKFQDQSHGMQAGTHAKGKKCEKT